MFIGGRSTGGLVGMKNYPRERGPRGPPSENFSNIDAKC